MPKEIQLMDIIDFDSIYHAELVIERYYKRFNEKRRYGAVNWKEAEPGFQEYNPGTLKNEKLLSLFRKLSRQMVLRD